MILLKGPLHQLSAGGACMCVRMRVRARWINAINRELDLSAIGTTFFSTQDLEPEEEEREENAFIQNNCLWVINIWKEAYSLANPCTCFQLFIHILGGGKGGDGGGCRSWREGGGLSGTMEKEKWFFFFSLTQPEGLWEYAIRHDEMKMVLSQRVDYELMKSGQQNEIRAD